MNVKLSDILEAMEFQSEFSRSFLNKETGEIVYVTDDIFLHVEDSDDDSGLFDEEQEQAALARDILDTNKYIEFPEKDAREEWTLLRDFCQKVSDEKTANELYNLIQGKGAFQRFKHAVIRYGLEDDWYEFRDQAQEQAAIAWCRENGIEYE
ncbi:MAG: UPF0158 family protein [candidate division KSB1 bacterium]|nr:UPF0158 family protein [candidate division KSB1 bacterium]